MRWRPLEAAHGNATLSSSTHALLKKTEAERVEFRSLADLGRPLPRQPTVSGSGDFLNPEEEPETSAALSLSQSSGFSSPLDFGVRVATPPPAMESQRVQNPLYRGEGRLPFTFCLQ
ncbi:hypothetical protein AMELA_G00228750 [Ameiurus melas]|uniref:Uncharacterized protein n=1 Tax=Ameiurus melas TaxID=219545 RepID=A0A7J5ZWB5_AMEME|nr:hypothetical protein AMELA_G00228750 [Ameiurus melas]